MSDIIERLRGYNPPDRAVDSDYQVAKDIHDALEEIQRLNTLLEHCGNKYVDVDALERFHAQGEQEQGE